MAWIGTIKEWWQRWLERFGSKLWLGLAILLLGGLSFQAGYLLRATAAPAPLVIRTPEVSLPAQSVEKTVPVTGPTTPTPPPLREATPSACAFVGSKKSNKYHLPTSRCAKQIKAENKICFADVEAARAKGYVPGCLE